jgi:PIN domain nuclease of toxin-antitoxin system
LKLLLDSNVLLWSIFDRKMLSSKVRRLIEDDAHEIFVSVASVWEISIKVAKGKLALPGGSIRYVMEQIQRTETTVLPLSNKHILRVETLPHHHGDPFDRMIVAQAMEEGCVILSSDVGMAAYDARVIWR